MPRILNCISIFFLAAICALALSFMLWASFGSSGTMDELAHIPSGYAYVRYLDFRLNPEHPPLIKAIAAFPLLFVSDLRFPTEHKAWTEDVNGQWDMGRAFLYQSGNNPDTIIRLSRAGPMLLTLLLIILVYVWARKLWGAGWALLPAALMGLSPHTLAHGEYVTTDVGAALGIVLASYFFLKALMEPSWKSVAFAGIAFGIAELMKFSAVLLIPYFVILAAVHFFIFRAGERFWRRLWHYARNLALVFLIGYLLLVYPAYALFTQNYPIERQASETEYILSSFAEGPPEPGEQCNPVRCLAELNIWMARRPLTRPLAHYMLGVLMVIQRAAGGNTSYFLGEVSNIGSRLYFPVVYLLKESLPALIFFLSWLLYALWRAAKAMRGGISRNLAEYLRRGFPQFALGLFAFIYWAWSVKSPLNIGFRHLFPALPLMYILAAGFWKNFVTSIPALRADSWMAFIGSLFKTILRQSGRAAIVALLTLWFIGETVFAAPYFLSYFNQFGGGVFGGYRYVTDSNYDWGQDLLRLKNLLDRHPEIDKVAIDYFGAGTPGYYLGNKVEGWWSSRGNPKDHGIEWFAVSINFLQGSIQPLNQWLTRNPDDEYRWLVDTKGKPDGLGMAPAPDLRAGTSIFLYKL